VEYNPDWYSCHFKNLTYDWAYTFFEGTVKWNDEGWAFPVGFVQVPSPSIFKNLISIFVF